MRLRDRLGVVGWLLLAALVFGQTSQQASSSQSTGTQPNSSQPATTQPANPQPANPQPETPGPVKPSAVDAAAAAARQARESAPPIKVIRNHDLSDGSNPPAAKSA